MAFIAVAKKDELLSGEMLSVSDGDVKVLLVNVDGTVYAYEDRCAHMGVPLSRGTLNNNVLICGAHHWSYNPCTGSGVNPDSACLQKFPVKVEGNDIFVDFGGAETEEGESKAACSSDDLLDDDRVGPVFLSGRTTDAVVAAICSLSKDVKVVDKDAYLRVLAPRECTVTREAIEEKLGRSFEMPGDLEKIMCSFKGGLKISEDRATWTLNGEDSGGNGRTAGGIAQKTYWHLADRLRGDQVPSEYEVVSSRLHYYREKGGFEVAVPLQDWYRQYQDQSAFQCPDWELFADPRSTTYESYVRIQDAKEQFVDGLLESADAEDYDLKLSSTWLENFTLSIAPLVFPFHGFQMIASYVGQIAPASRITICSMFQAADEMRRIQRIAYRLRQLELSGAAELCQPERDGRSAGNSASLQDLARNHWQYHEMWQPLRKAVEYLLVTYDWGDSFAGLNLVLKPLVDDLTMNYLGKLAQAEGDYVVREVLSSLAQDCAWQRDWTRALVKSVLEQSPEMAGVLNRSIEKQWNQMWQSIEAFAPAFDMPSQIVRFQDIRSELLSTHQEYLDSMGLALPADIKQGRG